MKITRKDALRALDTIVSALTNSRPEPGDEDFSIIEAVGVDFAVALVKANVAPLVSTLDMALEVVRFAHEAIRHFPDLFDEKDEEGNFEFPRQWRVHLGDDAAGAVIDVSPAAYVTMHIRPVGIKLEVIHFGDDFESSGLPELLTFMKSLGGIAKIVHHNDDFGYSLTTWFDRAPEGEDPEEPDTATPPPGFGIEVGELTGVAAR